MAPNSRAAANSAANSAAFVVNTSEHKNGAAGVRRFPLPSVKRYSEHNILSLSNSDDFFLPEGTEATGKAGFLAENPITGSDFIGSRSPLAIATDGQPDVASAVFEPNLPDTTTLIGLGSVLAISIIAGLVWANEVVPVSRTRLAISKNRGEVKEYLDSLKEGASPSEEEDISLMANSTDNGAGQNNDGVVKPDVGDGRDFERWLFSDWLNNNAGAKSGRQKEPALPILKQAKWNSGDNPVLAASALIGLCVIIASLTERVGSQLGSF